MRNTNKFVLLKISIMAEKSIKISTPRTVNGRDLDLDEDGKVQFNVSYVPHSEANMEAHEAINANIATTSLRRKLEVVETELVEVDGHKIIQEVAKAAPKKDK